MVELFEKLLELASQSHNNCRYEESGEGFCEVEGIGGRTFILEDHRTLARARKMLAEMKKY